MAYLLISPCRNEAAYMRETLDSVIAQSLRPARTNRKVYPPRAARHRTTCPFFGSGARRDGAQWRLCRLASRYW
jgi:hypothetical protein